MRAFVLLLAVLAGLKIWASEQLFRSAAEEALVAAYRDRAVAACQREAAAPRDYPARDAKAVIAAHAAAAQAWGKHADIRLVIGKRSVEVNIWDTDNALWNMRYKYPYLVLAAPAGTGLGACEYDITLGQTAITRL